MLLHQNRKGLSTARQGYLYLAPFVLLFFAFGLFPLIYSAVISLSDARLQNPSGGEFVGLENYTALFADQFFWNALKNTVTLGFMAIGPQLVIALVVANLLNYRLKGQLFWRIAIIVPYATSVAAATLIFSQLYSENFGLVNGFLTTLGLPAVNWQSGTFASQVAIASIVTWRWVGYNALLYLAAMQAISPEQYEAAELDGASKFRQFLSITIPEIRGTIVFTVILSTIGGMQLFIEPLLYEGGPTGMSGGLSRQYQTLALYMYQQGWANNRLGYGSAIAFTTLVLILVVLAAGFLLVRLGRALSDANIRRARTQASLVASHPEPARMELA
ncbi:carbohydrate ABC transporter permease [Tessaracoccus palaemonis]|uniref:Sugar ABC transporter permease n=1 Tax=Tessaracoccus palaemonis TaxID=2829499 RepID=A0ABX8SL88_9ACTN|nr:sugar ABC transporter permease [Tessaracoccus palaemonis]QXT63714.1 sugar ABC transporter permease [Tessaracoccus palaemonis]